MGKKLPSEFHLKIDDIVSTGAGVGTFEGRRMHVFGALPGETVNVRPLRVSRKYSKALVLDVVEPSPLRRKEKDSHFLSCGPFQILPEDQQLVYKKKFVRELFQEKAGYVHSEDFRIVPSPRLWNYRNKMEFSFTRDEHNHISQALFQRGRYNKFYLLDSCALAHERINECSKHIIQILNEKAISPEVLKSVVLRYSYHEDKCLAVLYVKDKSFSSINLDYEHLKGWLVIYSDPLSPASVTTEVLSRGGEDCLMEKVGGVVLKFFYDSFFQIQPEAFNGVIDFLKENIQENGDLSDLYSGVGTIGLALADKFSHVRAVESDVSAVSASKDNAERNKIKNITFMDGLAEKNDLIEIFRESDVLIVDPPRSGLHPKVAKFIARHGPKQVAYVSCNPLTQAADFASMQESYIIENWKLFDMYPQTPHLESVMILRRK